MSSKTTLHSPPPLNSERAPVENVLLVVSTSAELFTNAYPLWQPITGNAVFGGLLVGQAIQAAYQTVASGFTIHHLSCSFLIGPDASRPLCYYVSRPYDARRNATREVRAYQDEDKTVLSIICRFALTERAAPELHSTKIPHILPPPRYEAIRDPELAEKMIRSDFLYHKGQKATSRTDVDPFIWHHCNPVLDTNTIDLTAANSMAASYQLFAWVRSHGILSQDHASRMAVLGFLTDSWFIAGVTSMIPQHMGENLSRLKRLVTMDHHIWFHEPDLQVTLDDWMLVRTRITWAAQGRCLLEQYVWSRQGRLVLTCFQEGVLRITGPGKPAEMKL